MGQVVSLDLPAPPSVNHYWRRGRNKRVYISKRGKVYRQAVVAAVKPLGFRCHGRLAVSIIYAGKLDLDNILKCLLDSLEHADLFDDDNQIDELTVCRSGEGETLTVEVREL